MEETKGIYPCFEILGQCSCGRENPLFCYNHYFFKSIEEFANKFIKDKETISNVDEKHQPKVETLRLCCMSCVRYGQVISISGTSSHRVGEEKKPVSYLPGPGSDDRDTLTWA